MVNNTKSGWAQATDLDMRTYNGLYQLPARVDLGVGHWCRCNVLGHILGHHCGMHWSKGIWKVIVPASVISWTVCVNNGQKESPCQVSNFWAKCRIATPSSRCLLWTMVKNTALSGVSQILALTRLGSLTKWSVPPYKTNSKYGRIKTLGPHQHLLWPPSSSERGRNKRTHFRSIEALPPYELRPKSYENYTCS